MDFNAYIEPIVPEKALFLAVWNMLSEKDRNEVSRNIIRESLRNFLATE